MFFDNIFSSDKFYYPIENTDDLDLYLLLKKFEQDNNLELEYYYDKKYIWIFNPPKKLIASFNKKFNFKDKRKKSSFKAFNLDEMIIKKIKVIKDPNLELSNQVIVKTNDENIFKKILKNHYYLQKGSLEYFRSDKESIYFIKITNPSYWILFSEYEVGKDLFLYNSVSEKLDTNLKGLYLEYGYKFRDLTLAKKIYLLGGITLLQNQGEISSYNFIWDNYLNLIKLELPEIILEKNNDNEKIIVKPRLVEDNRKIDSVAWLISDIEKLSKILDNINYENLEHFKAFYGEKDIFITSLPSADNNLKNILTDTFEAFYLINKKIYLPINNSLMPRLPERILIEYWDIKEKEIVFLQNKDEEIKITSVSTIKRKKLTDFIEYYLEKKLETFEPFNSSWNFDFQNLKKKPITFQYSVKSENKFLEDKVTPVEIKNTKVESIENRNIKIIDLSSFNKDLEELDKLLANDIHNSSLWYKRSLLNEKRNLYESSFISKCTGLILDKNLDEIFKLLEDYFKKDFNEFSKNNLSEIEKGAFLNKIRSGNLDAEFNFLLELYYSIKFKEKNLFDAITDKMRNGYINSNIEFNEMNDFKLTSVKEKDPSFLNDLSKLKKKFDKILNCFDSNNEEEKLLKNLISKQYSSMIEENLSSDSANIIFGELKEIDYETNINPAFLELIKKHWLYIDNPEKYPIKSNETSFLNWKEAFKMKNVKNIPVKDLFTGRVYQRMTFSSDFEEKLSNLTQELHEYYIDGNFSKLNFETVLSEEKKGIKNNDRKELFKAKSQRLLLRTVTDFGASEAFNKLIGNFEYNSNFNIVVMNCDIYRLKLIYKHIFSEESFFKALEENLPHYFVDFRDAVENMILCLFLSSTTQKESFLISLCKKTIEKFKESSKTDFFLHEILVLFAYIGATSLLETLPESIAEYNFKERRKSIWMDFTFNIREKFNDYEW